MNKNKLNTSWYSGSNHTNLNEQPESIVHMLWVFTHTQLSKMHCCCMLQWNQDAICLGTNKRVVHVRVHEKKVISFRNLTPIFWFNLSPQLYQLVQLTLKTICLFFCFSIHKRSFKFKFWEVRVDIIRYVKNRLWIFYNYFEATISCNN